MRWRIPAKTFIVGEYVALQGGPALILTTEPSFELSILEEDTPSVIHKDSPAGHLLKKESLHERLSWHDPYNGLGGFGASSAQFLGAYYAQAFLKDKPVDREALLKAYFDCSWSGEGLRPSGYDVLAQHMQGCVYLHREQNEYISFAWPFVEVSFVLIHTGHKLQTHEHLKQVVLRAPMARLTSLVGMAKEAFITADAQKLIDAVNGYHAHLHQLHWVAPHTVSLIEQLRQDPDVLAVKGCGAMGADVLLILVPTDKREPIKNRFLEQGYVTYS